MTAKECIEEIKKIIIRDTQKVNSPIRTMQQITNLILEYESNERLQGIRENDV
jgi:hypothetical protein